MINWSKNKPKINLVIDAIMFLLLMAIAGLGLLMKYVLVPGYRRIGLYDNNVEHYFLGLTRHDWGSIHLWLSFVFLFLLSLHLILHWKLIVCIFRQIISGKRQQTILAIFIGTAGLFLLLYPLFIKPEEGEFMRKYRHRSIPPLYPDRNLKTSQSGQQNINKKIYTTPEYYQKKRAKPGNYQTGIIRVYNYMTLDEISENYNISPHLLAAELDIPANETGEKIVVLRRKYKFLLSDVRKAVKTLQEQ